MLELAAINGETKQTKEENKMTFDTFKKFAECGLRIAKDLAVANGVSLAQVDLWILRVSAK